MSTPAGDDLAGSARLVLTLSSDDAEADAVQAGRRIEQSLTRAVDRAARQMQRSINAAIRRISPARIRVEADLRAFGHSIDTLANFPPVSIQVLPDVDRQRFETAIYARIVGLTITVPTVPDMSGFNAAVRAHNAPTVTVNADVDRGLGRSLSSISGALVSVGKTAVGAAASLAGMVAPMAATAGAAAVLGIALAPTIGIVAALPAVIAGAVAANVALKLALNGVSDAFSAALTGSAEEFTAALEKLSPAAQSVAREVRALKNPFQELRSTVQDSFFRPLTGDITRVADALGGPLERGLAAISGNFGTAASKVADFIASSAGVKDVNDILKGAGAFTKGVADAIPPVIKGFLDVAAAVSDAFGGKAGKSIEDLGKKFGGFLTDAANSGDAVRWVRDAVGTFKQLGRIVENIGGVISGVFGAGGEAGADVGKGFLDQLEKITQSIEDFVKSPKGQEDIKSFFEALKTIGDTAVDVAGGLDRVGGAVTYVKEGIQGIVLAFQDFDRWLTGLADSVEQWGQGVKESLQNAWDTVILGASGVVTFFLGIPAMIGGALSTLGAMVGQKFNEAKTTATNVALATVNSVVGFFTGLPGRIGAALSTLGSFISEKFNAAKATAANVALTTVNAVVGFFAGLPARIGNALAALGGFIGQKFNAAKATAVSTANSLINSVTGFFAGLPGKAASAVGSIVGRLRGVFNDAKSAVLSRAGSLVTEAVALVRGLPSRAAAALGDLGGYLVGAGQALIDGFISGITSKLGAAKDAVGSVVGAVRDFFPGSPAKTGPFAGQGWVLYSGRAIGDGLAQGIADRAGVALRAAAGMAAGVVGATNSALQISSPSKVFERIGKDVGRGFVDGLTGSVASIKAAADRVAKSITDAFKGKNTRIDDVLVSQLRSTQAELTRLAGQRERIGARIKAANEFAASTTQSALQSFSLQNLFGEGTTATGLADSIGAATAKIRQFNNQINALAKRGLRKDLLSQIIGLGPDQGAGLAATLGRATSAQLDDLNEAQRQLDQAAKDLGRTSADSLFDAGRNAGAGFLQGLKDQEAAIAKEMKKIANSLAGAIRKALGIRSPSTVLARLGRFAIQGLALGIDDQIPAVGRSALRAASALTDPFGAGVSAPRIGGRFSGGASGGTASGGTPSTTTTSTRTVTNNNTFNVTAVGDPEVTAQRVLNRLVAAGAGL